MISKGEIINAMDMAKIKLTDLEIEELEGELSRVLDYIKNIEDIDLEGVEPRYTITDHSEVLREDIIMESLDVKDVLSNTVEKQYGFFKLLNIMD